MKILEEKNKKWIAWGVVISLVLGTIFASFSAGSVQAAGSRLPGARVMSMALADNSPLSDSQNTDAALTETSAPASSPAVTSTPQPTATPYPVLTPNPNANILLGSSTDQDITLYMGDKGIFDIDRSNTDEFSPSYTSSLTRIEYRSSNNLVLQVGADGSYQAVAIGRTVITVSGYDDNYGSGTEAGLLFEREYTIIVYPDMKNVTLQETSVIIYKTGYYYNDDDSVSIKINSDYILDEGNDEIDIRISSSNNKMHVQYTLVDNVLTLSCSSVGTTTIQLIINGKEFNIRLKVVSVKMSASSVLLAKRHTKSMRVKGYSGKVTWKSSNKKTVSVNSKGKIKARREGNAVITAKADGFRLGCVVSVTTSRKVKVIALARKIARTSKYSQPKRMQKGYYDCSSLVWRAYAPYGCKFGAYGYAPVAADEAKWLAGRNRLLKGGYSQKNVEKMKINAGDLLFETGANNGRYRGIYHVEMIAGYEFYGFDDRGKAMVVSKWANRPDGYYGYGCGIVGRV